MNLQTGSSEKQLNMGQNLALGFQHVFAMFGATVLVPLLTGLDPSVAFFTSGIGTLLFILLTKKQVPAYLGSSFAFITPIVLLSRDFGLPYALGGAVIAGLVYVVIALIIAKIGLDWIDRLLPPVVIGSVIMVIGLGLASHAVQNLAGLVEGSSLADANVQVALFTLAVTLQVNIWSDYKIPSHLPRP
ncbi:MAG TPA: hypothetical protein GX521_04540, partial [Firmicutes bacterium]|nr:hypothetical protein [Bacillota bacterium]